MEEFRNDIVWRLWLIYWLLFLAGMVVLGQVIYIQFVKGDEYRKLAEDKTIRTSEVAAIRGNILAIDGSLLATTVPIFDIRLDVASKNFTDKEFYKKVDSIALGLSKIFNDKNKNTYKKLLIAGRKNENHYLFIQKGVNFAELKQVQKLPILRRGKFKGGLITEQQNIRKMPYGLLARRTIGYENSTLKLYVGLEGAYNEDLSGTSGKVIEQKIAGGEWIPVMNSERVEPHNGKDIVTTIDKNLQDVAETALLHHLEEQGAYQGCAILMEVKTGEIRAIANLRKNKAGKYDEIYNYALAESIEPGSTFKLASLLAILEEGGADLNDVVPYSGSVKFANRTMRDSHTLPLTHISLRQAMEQSSNVGISLFTTRCFGHNPQKYVDRLYNLSINLPLGIELAGENPPFIKDTKHRNWSKTSLPWMSIGYELKLTPLQTLTLYNAVANNGIMVKPMFVKEIRYAGKSEKICEPTIINKAICSAKTIAKAQQVLKSIVTNGTAKDPFKNTPYTVAGKTGTALIANKGSYVNKIYNASFVGYFPADNPKYSCIVIVNNPSEGKIYGGVVAAPVFREIADRVFATNVTVNDTTELYTRAMPLADSTGDSLPPLSTGHSADMVKVARMLNLNITNTTVTSEWSVCTASAGHLILVPKRLGKNYLPDVSGMTARDAVYLLESYGLRVKIIGKGKVISQSLMAGSKAVKGNEITITLTNS